MFPNFPTFDPSAFVDVFDHKLKCRGVSGLKIFLDPSRRQHGITPKNPPKVNRTDTVASRGSDPLPRPAPLPNEQKTSKKGKKEAKTKENKRKRKKMKADEKSREKEKENKPRKHKDGKRMKKEKIKRKFYTSSIISKVFLFPKLKRMNLTKTPKKT